MLISRQNFKKRWRRLFKKSLREVEDFGQQADQNIEKLILRRWNRMVMVRRFIFIWVSFFAIIFFVTFWQIKGFSGYYQTPRPVAGGIFSEGMVGTITNLNPVYSTGSADSTVSKLIFSGLFKYDRENNLIGDLASRYKVDKTGLIYTVTLKNRIFWHDGQNFSADDVVFTYKLIQNAEAQSPLNSSWQGIKVKKVNDHQVSFELPNPLASFPYALTNGIVPAHLLRTIEASEMRSASFNTSPIGTGPFKWKFVEVTGQNVQNLEQRVTLAPNSDYYGGRPKLNGYTVWTFQNEKQLIKIFKQHKLNAMSGFQTIPDDIRNDTGVRVYATPMTSSVMAFFNNNEAPFNDPKVRKAFAMAIDKRELLSQIEYSGSLVDGPLLRGQLGYSSKIVQPGYDMKTARSLLRASGWGVRDDGKRTKKGQTLSVELLSQDSSAYTQVASYLQKQWSKLGADVVFERKSADDVQAIIASHGYQAVLYGINIGVDPDVFAYWDSSQISVGSQGHLNISEYKSTKVDRALELARIKLSPELRVAKYREFLKEWVADVPAVGLYQPANLFITHGPVFNYDRKAMNSAIDRYNNVEQWMVREEKQNIIQR